MYWEPFGVALVLKMLSVRFPAGGIGGAFPILPRGSPRMLPPPGGKCRAQRGDRGIAFPPERLSAASPLPPSDEGGGKATGFDGGRDDWERTPALGNTSAFSAPPQSAPQTAPPLGAPCRAPLFSHASPIGGSGERSEPIGGHAFPIIPRGGKCHGFSSSSPLCSGIRSGPKAKTKRKTAA